MVFVNLHAWVVMDDVSYWSELLVGMNGAKDGSDLLTAAGLVSDCAIGCGAATFQAVDA